jgi:hypothetical protein
MLAAGVAPRQAATVPQVRHLLAAIGLVLLPGAALDRVLALAGSDAAVRGALVVVAVVAGAVAAALICPPAPRARAALVAAALAVALEPVGDGLVLPVMAAALALVVVWLVDPVPAPVPH